MRFSDCWCVARIHGDVILAATALHNEDVLISDRRLYTPSDSSPDTNGASGENERCSLTNLHACLAVLEVPQLNLARALSKAVTYALNESGMRRSREYSCLAHCGVVCTGAMRVSKKKVEEEAFCWGVVKIVAAPGLPHTTGGDTRAEGQSLPRTDKELTCSDKALHFTQQHLLIK